MVNYPINPLVHPQWELLFSLDIIMVFIFMEISVFFFHKYLNNKKNAVPSVVELDWGILFCCFGTAYIFYIIGDFYPVNRDNFLILGYLSLVIGGTLFLFHLEASKTVRTKYLLTFIASSCLVVFLVVFFWNPSMLQTTAYFISFFAFGVVIFYFIVIIQKIWAFYKFYSFGLFLGIFLWLLGYAATTDIAITWFGTLNIRVLGDLTILIGMVLVAFFVNSIPSLSEIGWRNKIKYVIISSSSGVCLYSENFQERKEINELLLSGAVWGIQVFLKNVLEEEGRQILVRGTDVIIIDKGKNTIGIVIAEQELEILKYLLRKLIDQFENYFANILASNCVKIDLYKPTRHLVNEIFSIEKL